MTAKPLEQRFWPKVDRRGPDECWPWCGAKDSKGYGRIDTRGRIPPRQFAHRVAWELAHAASPGELFVCHHCDNPPCVNPAHLFLGTNQRDRAAKGRSASQKKTHCPRGHPYSPENTYLYKTNRACRICVLAGQKRRRREKLSYEEAIRAHDIADYCELIVRKANKQSKRDGGMPKKLPPSNK